jgi:tetratricopeptide (TPR) repeat protein
MIALESVDHAAGLAIEQGNPEEAIARLDKAITTVPDNFNLYVMRSQAYDKMDKNMEALKDIDAALTIDPMSTRALGLKARLLLKIDKPGPAVKYVSKAINIKPDCGSCYYGRGVLISN